MDIIQSTTGFVLRDCLFGIAKGFCTYNRLNPPIYLSLGDALAASGLMFAAYQLRSEKWKIVLNIRPKWQSLLPIVLTFVGLGLTLASALIVETPTSWTFTFSIHPLFFEVLAFISFGFAPFTYIYFASKSKYLLNEKNITSFSHEALVSLARSIETYNIIIDLVRDNIDELTRTSGVESYDKQKKELFNIVLSDSTFISTLVSTRHDATMIFISKLSNSEIDWRNSLFTQYLFRELFINKDSYLQKHRTFRGLGISNNPLDRIFKDSKVIANLKPFTSGSLSYAGDISFNELYFDAFCDALEASVEAYLDQKLNSDSLPEINVAFHRLIDYLENPLDRTLHVPEYIRKRSSKFFHEALFQYTNYMINRQPDSTKKLDLNQLDQFIGEAFYAYIIMLSYVSTEKEVENEKRYELWSSMLKVYNLFNDVTLNSVANIVSEKVWKKINGSDDYPSNIQGYFPNIFRVYAPSMLLSTSRIGLVEKKKIVQLLYNQLLPKLNEKTQARDGRTFKDAFLLEDYIVFDTMDQHFYRKDLFGKRTKIEKLS